MGASDAYALPVRADEIRRQCETLPPGLPIKFTRLIAPLNYSLRYQHDLPANAMLKDSDVRCGRFRQSHLSTDDGTQQSLGDPGQDVQHHWLYLCCCRVP